MYVHVLCTLERIVVSFFMTKIINLMHNPNARNARAHYEKCNLSLCTHEPNIIPFLVWLESKLILKKYDDDDKGQNYMCCVSSQVLNNAVRFLNLHMVHTSAHTNQH